LSLTIVGLLRLLSKVFKMSRGLLGNTEYKLEDAIHQHLSNRFGVESARVDDIVVPPDALYVDGAWVFKDLMGYDYPKKFIDCDSAELGQIASAFFYKIRELQQQLKAAELKAGRLDRELAVQLNPALQLLA